MITTEYNEQIRKWNCFAESDILGSFDFRTTIVELNSLSTLDIEACRQSVESFLNKNSGIKSAPLSDTSYANIVKVHPLAAHEYTHFLDATSTLWGLNHLLLMKEAYESNEKYGGTEKEFYKAKLFHDHIRGIRLPKYYTVVSSSTENIKPWSYQHTSGKIFDAKGKVSNLAAVFTRFLNCSGQSLVRSPISMASVFEMSAMAQEILTHLYYLENTEDSFRAIEANLYSHELMESLYNPRITEYSVCVHLVANKLKTPDALIAFRVCACLSRVILNMPGEYFDRLAKPELIADILSIPEDHEFIERLVNGLQLQDYGILFFVISSALTQDDWNESQEVEILIRAVLKRLDVSTNEMQSKSQSEALRLYKEIGSSRFPEITTLAQAGYENYTRIESLALRIRFEELNLPPILLSDLSSTLIFQNDGNQLAAFDLDSAHDSLCVDGYEWVERFTEACL